MSGEHPSLKRLIEERDAALAELGALRARVEADEKARRDSDAWALEAHLWLQNTCLALIERCPMLEPERAALRVDLAKRLLLARA